MLLCADILTLCFVGWVILIWNRCFFTCWFESTAKGKSWEFSGIFCESGPPCHGCLKQKSQTPTYDANQGSYFGGTQSPCRSPGSCGSSEREATLKTKPFLSFFFFVCVLGSKQEHEYTDLSHFQIDAFLCVFSPSCWSSGGKR